MACCMSTIDLRILRHKMSASTTTGETSGTATRPDGRMNASLRPLASDQTLLNRSDGSACFAQGATVVLAAVYGPVQKYNNDVNQGGIGIVDVVYKPPDGSATGAGTESKENQVVMASTLSQIVLLSMYPQTTIRFTIQVLDDCGSSLAAAINAASLALIDAGVYQKGMAVAVCCAVMPDGSIRIDPTSAEESAASALMTTAWHSVSRDIIACRTSGIMSRREYTRCVMASKEALGVVIAFIRMSFVAKCKQQHHNPDIQDVKSFLNNLENKE